MAEYVMRVEGVNFATTMLDTQDLSCIRGASLALLHAIRRVEWLLTQQDGLSRCRKIHDGASQAAFRFQAEDKAALQAAARVHEALETEGDDPDSHRKVLRLAEGAEDRGEWQGAIPLAHLSFVVDLVKADNSEPAAIDVALALAEARNRARQFQSLTVRVPKMDKENLAIWPDELSRVLPAVSEIMMPPDSVTPLPEERDPDPDDKAMKTRMSRSVAARRHYGRHMRQFFYQSELGRSFKDIRFTDSIESMCEQPPKDIPESIRNKMAVLHFDGNGFTKIRNYIADHKGKAAALESFSQQLGEYRRELLGKVMDRLIKLQGDGDKETMKRGWVDVARAAGRALRFETLEWAGDDVLWVAPSWLAFWLAEAFFTLSRSWTVDGYPYPLTHAAGIVLCDRKTPIRQARAMAEYLGKRAKKTMEWPNLFNVLQVEVFESADLPEGGADSHRRALYPGLTDTEVKDEMMAATFTLPAGRLSALIDLFEEPFQETPAQEPTKGLLRRLPRSQIYPLLRRSVT